MGARSLDAHCHPGSLQLDAAHGVRSLFRRPPVHACEVVVLQARDEASFYGGSHGMVTVVCEALAEVSFDGGDRGMGRGGSPAGVYFHAPPL